MIKILKRAGILVGIFLVAVGIYLVISWNHTEESETVYTSMEAPSLPVVFARMYDSEENRLVGYRQQMDMSVARDALTILPEDRQLTLRVGEYGASPLSVSYEIRSLDAARLVERTQVESWSSQNGESIITLPIQNMLTTGVEYLLHVQLETEQHGQIHYYTRILLPGNDYGPEMMALAREFSAKSFDEAEAASLVTYLETTSTADNSSLGSVTLKSSFSQLTWAGLEMTPITDMQVTLKELQGIMGQVSVTYQVRRQSEEGDLELYDVEDYYTMRWGDERIYMMDFKRTTNQVFSGRNDFYSGRRITLGIGNDDVIERVKSANGRYLAFVFNRDLWLYDQTGGTAVKLFSFRGESDASRRGDYDHHGIKILAVGDSGDVDFLVYGYMNRGAHEGWQGVSVCHYDEDRRGAIEEKFFVPVTDSFDELKREVGTLCHLSSQNMLYLFLDRAVFGIDLSSNEHMVVTQNLNDGSYCISSDQKWFAWQEGGTAYGAGMIHVMDMDSGIKQEVEAPAGTVLRALGFVQDDFVYGMAEEGNEWIVNGRVEALPMNAIEIADAATLESQTRYDSPGLYIVNVRVEEARIHLERLTRSAPSTYEYQDSDTIICNTADASVYMEGIGWYASEIRRKIYFIQLDKEVNSTRGVRVSVAQRIGYDQSEQLTLSSPGQPQDMRFYAYSRGKLAGIYKDFDEAVGAVYESMGLVTDQHQRILWNRVNRVNIRGLQEPQTLAYEILRYMDGFSGNMETPDDMAILDARGLTLQQMLYFIGQGYPVIAYTENGNYLLLCGYDQFNVTLMDPNVGERHRMGLNDAAAYFENYGNDFVCAVRLGG